MLLKSKILIGLSAAAFILMSSLISLAATITYTYDQLNRLTKVDYGNGITEEYTYDAAGNRLSLRVSGVPTPVSAITRPTDGAVLIGDSYTVTGTVSDNTGYGIEKVEVSTDGGTTWHLATNTGTNFSTWSYDWTFSTDGTYSIKVRATDRAGNVESTEVRITVTVAIRQRSTVKVSGRQLLVDGSPFSIKGVGYSPVPIGVDPETTPPYGDYFTAAYSSIYNRDLPLLREMGANTIRLWGWDNTANHLDFLDQAYNGGIDPIYVIVTFWMGPAKYPDISSAGARAQIKADFRAMVAAYKNHPAVLMWAIGNELNADWMYGGDLNDLFSLINEMAEEAHAEEGSGYHPVTTALMDSNLISTIATYGPSVSSLDIWGANVYRGNTFGSLFAEYQTVSDKPLVILEYGIDAYDNANGDEYENIGTPYQATYAEALWNEIAANSDVCVGGSIMAYSDEWWKGKYSTDPGCPDNDPAYHSPCGYASSSHPDGYADEEWWGIMRTKDNGSNPDIMEPRAVYYTLQAFWSGGGPDISPSSQSITLGVGWNLVSLGIKPSNPALEDILSAIRDKVITVWAWERSQSKWEAWSPLATMEEMREMFGLPDLMALTQIGLGRGYWFNMQAEITLTVTGVRNDQCAGDQSQPISLGPGWNLTGFSHPSTPTGTFLTNPANFSGNMITVWAWNGPQSTWEVFSPLATTDQINEIFNANFLPLTTIESGRGYWFNLQGAIDVPPPPCD